MQQPANLNPADLASASVPETLAVLHVNQETGPTHAEVGACRQEHGFNEVAEQKGHPIIEFLRKFWGISAWMLELIMVLSAVLRKYSDLAVVSALLVVNAVLSFIQEHRAAGVAALRWRRGLPEQIPDCGNLRTAVKSVPNRESQWGSHEKA